MNRWMMLAIATAMLFGCTDNRAPSCQSLLGWWNFGHCIINAFPRNEPDGPTPGAPPQ